MEMTWELLSKYASNTYSYAGEDGIVAELLKRLDIVSGYCVEFGADDGVECSNTKALRDKGWSALLIEGDPQRAIKLKEQASHDVECLHRMITLEGRDSIDTIVKREPELMSIDVDGDDYFIMQSMFARPEVLIVEYNQTVPWFMDVRAKSPGNRFGASALSLHRLAESMSYVTVAATETNLIFVHNPRVRKANPWGPYKYGLVALDINISFENIMTELPSRGGFIVTDYTRHRTDINTENMPKWGFQSTAPKDELVIAAEFYPGNSPAMSERAKRERHHFDR